MRRAQFVRAAASAVALLIVSAAAGSATATPLDGLTAYGPRNVTVPFHRLYAFRVTCAALPCAIHLHGQFFAAGRPLRGLIDTPSGPIMMRRQPHPGQLYATWYTPMDFNSGLLGADLRRYHALTLRATASLTDADGVMTDDQRQITLRPQSLPVLIAGPYRGRRPANIDLSGDAGNIVTHLRWTSWGQARATATGTSNIQSCVPNCAEGTETPVSTSIELANPRDGYFTTLIEHRIGQTEVFHYTPGHTPDLWPEDAS